MGQTKARQWFWRQWWGGEIVQVDWLDQIRGLRYPWRGSIYAVGLFQNVKRKSNDSRAWKQVYKSPRSTSESQEANEKSQAQNRTA